MFQNNLATKTESILREAIPIINKYREMLWYRVDDDSKLAYECYREILRSASHMSDQGSTKGLTIFHIKNHVKRHCDRKKQREMESLEKMTEEWEDKDLDFKDDLAVVDDALLVNEKITFLAGGDVKRRFILKAWSEGYDNESKLAVLLSQRFGGKTESHHKFIRRFRVECQKELRQIA